MKVVHLPFKTRLSNLPSPAPEEVLSMFICAAELEPAARVDLWDDADTVAFSSNKVDVTRLYQPIFDKPTEPFTAAKGFEVIAPLSSHVRNKVQKNYQQRVNRSGVIAGEAYLRETIQKLTVVWHKYPFHKISGMKFVKHSTQELDDNEDMDPESRALVVASPFSAFRVLRHRKSTELKRVATQIADTCMQQVKEIAASADKEVAYFDAYDVAAKICQIWGVIPPYWNAVKRDHIEDAAECAILRMTCAKWWGRQLLKLRDQCCEHLCVTVDLVNRASPFVSDECFSEWTSQQRTAMQWLESTMIENEAGVILPLIEAAMAGNANPSNRLVELIVRARGLDEMAVESGKIGFMVTLTCPSKFHMKSHKWDLNNAKTAQQYLVNVFAKIRAALSYRNIPFTGCRVTEPHKDSTPHWHMLCMVKPEHELAVKAIINKYAYEVDGDEPGAKEHRLLIEAIDKQKGCAVGYIIKYLSKNIMGEHMQGELDLETGKPVNEVAPRATAWANRHRIRQFQFYGTSSVQVWRELRRLKVGPQSPEIEAAKAAACNSDWKAFEYAMKNAQLSLNYEVTPQGNEYGEMTKRVQGISGIAFGEKRLIITRGERWKLRKANDDELEAYKTLKQRRKDLFTVNRAMNAESRLSRKELKDAMPKWSMALLPLPLSSPWTCRNNCTDPVLGEVDSRIIRHLTHVGITDPANIERLLFDGCRVMDADGGEWWVDDGQLRNEPYRYHEIRDLPLDELVSEMQSWGKLWSIQHENTDSRL
jgi:hypothetical protein